MKRVLWLLLPVFLFSAPKMPLLEMFTSVNCPGCGPADDTLDDIYAQYQGQIAIVRYHVWWVGTDPYNQANPLDVFNRVNFYGIPYSPYLWINGNINGDYTADQWRALIVSAIQDTSPVIVNVQLGVDTSFGAVQVVTSIQHTGQDTISAHLYSVLVEDSLYYLGSNGHPWHHQVMRKMLPSSYGKAITLYPGMMLQDTEYAVLDPVWVPGNLRAVVFLQNISTKQVYQTGFSEATFVEVSESSTPSLPGRIEPVIHRKGVRFLGLKREAVKQFRVYSADGRSIPARLRPSENSTELTPIDAQKGVYFYRITLDDGRQLSGRLILF